MIPPYLPPTCTSAGERSLFQKFASGPGTEGWVVLHALDVARHPSQLAGEIDFVVIVPEQGVLCLEVKGGPVSRRDGRWIYGHGEQTTISAQGPFAQAASGMHAIRKHLARREPALTGILFYSAVFFPSIEFRETSIEWQPWQIVDRSTMAHESLSECCLRILRCAHDHVRSTGSARWYHGGTSRPNAVQVGRLVEVLRDDFEFAIPPRAALEDAETAILRFTEEQYGALDILEENARVVFKGPAGTGKTFLALEAAHRAALAGRRTLLACESALGGQWLAREARARSSSPSDLVFAGSINSVFRRLVADIPKSPARGEVSDDGLPALVAEEALEGHIPTPAFEALVLDDAQELLTDDLLDALDLLLVGGLAGGRWAVFGDFEPAGGPWVLVPSDSLERLRRRAPIHFTFPLRVNCRATPQLAHAVEAARPAGPGYTRTLLEAGGPEPQILTFHGHKEQEQLLREVLIDLLRVYSPREIVVLSAKSAEGSCAPLVARENPDLRLRSFAEGPAKPDEIGFTSIQEFRGLEAPAVVLTDIDNGKDPLTERLLYIGASRARHRLIILRWHNDHKAQTEIGPEPLDP